MKTELLSPAGDMECLEAAINAGADAVYVGGIKYGARAYASNFTDEELIGAIDRLHVHDKKMYLTVNTLFKDEETECLYDYLYPLYREGLDAVLVQDMGVIKKIREMFPDLPLHASTQMAVTDTEGVKLLKELSVKRVVLARELSLKEITNIHKNVDTELECFIHGALCYSYSGKCLLSSFIGGRSGNRGRCAQPCRLPYPDKYYLSTRDICTLDILDRLVSAGIASLKIEGRMKSAEYVGSVTGIYRKYLDLLYEEGEGKYSVDHEDISKLFRLYSRTQNCGGYYFQKNGRNMITIGKPSYSTSDPELSKQTFEEYASKEPKLSVCGKISLHEGEEAELFVSLKREDETVSYTAFGEKAEKAVNAPLTEDEIIKQLEKTGGTEFVFKDLKIDAHEGIFIRNSALNALRRDALTGLKEALLERYRRVEPKTPCESPVKEDRYPDLLKPAGAGEIEGEDTEGEDTDGINKKLHVMLLNDLNTDKLADDDRIRIISVSHFALVDSLNVKKVDRDQALYDTACRLAPDIRKTGRGFFLILPSVLRNGFFKRYGYIKRLLDDEIIDGIVADSYEALQYLKDISCRVRVIADIHLYAYNRDAVSAFHSLGLKLTTTVPVELNVHEIKDRGIYDEDMIVYGYLPVMLSAQCVKNTRDKCDRTPSLMLLKDRYSHPFPVVNECSECQNTIYNYVPLYLEKKDIVKIQKLDATPRIMFLNEDDRERARILDYYGGIFCQGPRKNKPLTKYTKGHFNRGIL
ncbi:MAG: U32 family peptidase [Lachnospiraceae bacterium]|nr:U32 family peptidase [Lachnospiraceae bacterium]